MKIRQTIAWVLLAVLLASARSAEPGPGTDEWKLDVLYRKQGKAFRGLVVEDVPDHVLIKCILRKPGAPTVVITENIPRSEVDRVEALTDTERDALRRRLLALARERESLTARLKSLSPDRHETASADDLDLRKTTWPLDGESSALVYESKHFRLISNARREFIQLTAVQLEQVYAAYAHALPPRVEHSEPTTILLIPSMREYQAFLKRRGYDLLNPAFFDAGRNQVVCASDLERLADEMENVAHDHDRQREAIATAEAELRKAYKDRVPPELLRRLEEDRRKILATEERNAAAFDRARRRLFQRLHHEAFHAYLSTCEYPTSEAEIPRWLNEGLAQIFETAIVEVGELRVGHADKERYDLLRAALKKDDLLPLTDLLKSGPKQFIVAHGDERQASERYYLASWALAFHLLFERHLLGTRQFDDYVHSLRRGTDPLAAFQDLVGQPLADFEKDYFAYLRRLRLDGTAAAR